MTDLLETIAYVAATFTACGLLVWGVLALFDKGIKALEGVEELW